MPVDLEATRKSLNLSNRTTALLELEAICEATRRHTVMSNNTKLNLLGDKYGSSVGSMGDCLIIIGIYMVVGHFFILIMTQI